MTLALEPTKLYLSCKILTGHCPDFAVGTAVDRQIFVFHGIFKGKMAKNLVGMCYNHLVSTAELHFWDTPLATSWCMWSDGHKYLYVVFVYIFLVCCLCICICLLSLCGVCSEENCVLLLFTWIALPRQQLAVANPKMVTTKINVITNHFITTTQDCQSHNGPKSVESGARFAANYFAWAQFA